MNESKTVRYRRFLRSDQSSHLADGTQTARQITETSSMISATRSRTGTSVPNWRKLIRSGSNATSAFTGNMREIKAVLGNGWIKYWDNPMHNSYQYIVQTGWLTEPEFMNANGVPQWLRDDANNQALKLIYKRIREARTQFQGAVFLGELRETLKMIRNPLKALRTGVDDYLRTLLMRRRGVRSPKALDKILSETWLEYSFGWRPLLSDIADGYTAYERLRDKFQHTRFNATGRQDYITSEVVGQTGWASIGIIYRRRQFYRAETRYICGMAVRTYGSDLEEGRDMLGVTLKHFVPAAWEVLPWSFLVDYFVNVGELVEASVTNTNDLTWICKTERLSAIEEWTGQVDVAAIKASLGNNYIGCGGSPGTVETHHRLVNRGPATSLPFPKLQVGLPSRPTQWLNIAALVASRRSVEPYR